MQIREQGRQIQCIRSTYDKAKGRSSQKVVATFKRWQSTLPSEGIEELTDEERQELAAWLIQRQDKSQADNRAYAVVAASASLERIAAALGAGVEPTAEQAAAMWKGLGELGKALRKAGHPKPKPAPKPEPVAAVIQPPAPATASKAAKPARTAKPKPAARVATPKPSAASVPSLDGQLPAPAASAKTTKPDRAPKGKAQASKAAGTDGNA